MPRTYPSWLTGLDYSGRDGTNRRRYCIKLCVGDVIDLVREPDNPYDDGAVACEHAGRHIGYIPRKHAWIGNAIDEGQEIVCTVRSVETNGWWFTKRAERVLLTVTVLDVD